MDKEELYAVRDWNKFVRDLLSARKAWNRMQLRMDENSIWVENLPIKMQKILSRFRRMQFSVLLSDLVDHWRMSGGLEELYVELSNEEQEELKDGGKQRDSGRSEHGRSGESGDSSRG